jgi:hypothetical protein
VPFKKDAMFVGREDIIETINEKVRMIGHGHERIALVGLAGVGFVVPIKRAICIPTHGLIP